MFFDGWFPLLRVAVMAICGYIALISLLRATGKRTLSKLNAFDHVITVALGSTFATVVLSRDTSLASGVLALAMLVLLQFAVAWLSTRLRWFGRLIKSEPRLLFYRGQFLPDAMRSERFTEAEIRAVVREQGIGRLEEVDAVVLETAGSLSVVRAGGGHLPILADVNGARPGSPS